jgi:ABC-2 type transport system permease protein
MQPVAVSAEAAAVRRPPSAARLAGAALRRDFTIARSYRFPMATAVLSALLMLTLFYSLGRLVGERPAEPALGDHGYFAFVVPGLILLRLAETALISSSERLRAAQWTGTLETLLSGPARGSLVVLADSAYALAEALVAALATLVLAVVIFGLDLHAGPLAALAAVVATLGAVGVVLSVGLALAGFTILTHRLPHGAALLGTILGVLTGVWYPTDALPAGLQAIGAVLPFTWALDALRAALLDDEVLTGRLVAVLACDVVGIAVALWLVERALARARHAGVLGLY